MSDKANNQGHPAQQPGRQQSGIQIEKSQFSQDAQIELEGDKAQEDAIANSKSGPAGVGKKIKRVESGEEVVRAYNVASSPNDRRNSGIVIRVKSLEEVGYLPAKVLIEIRNESNLAAEEGGAPTRQTKLVPKNSPTWDEDFYYNNNVVLDDNITFILRAENAREEARAEVRNLSLLRKGQGEDSQIDRQLVELELKREDLVIAKLIIEISFYEREDLLGGVLMPNLSLRPPPGFKAQYNAIDTYKPEFENRAGSRANCFNFYDGDVLPGLDNVEAFPPKIQRRNRKVIEAE